MRPADSRRGVWPTPDWLFQPLHARFGFGLDAAASPANAKCRRYYTVRTSALERPWPGTWWCNPPYGCQPSTSEWVTYARREIERWGNRGVLLLPVKAETAWWQELVRGRNRVVDSGRVVSGPLLGCWYRLREPRVGDVEVLELRSRVSFARGAGRSENGFFASALVALHPPGRRSLVFGALA